MARLLYIPKEEHLQYLRTLINNNYGKNVVTIADCANLELKILFNLNKRLSVDTLARLFNIKKGKSLPSIFTLDTCASFVGYTDWNNLVKDYQNQSLLYKKNIIFELLNGTFAFEKLLFSFQNIIISKQVYEIFNQVILIKSQQKDVCFFENIFLFTHLFELREENKFSIYHTIHLLGTLCTKNKWLRKIATEHYYNLPFEEDYFVEWLVVPNQPYYFKLLENYYLNNKNQFEKIVFYHLIHCSYAFKIKEYDTFRKHYSILTTLNIKSDTINHILQMRWWGVQLIHHFYLSNMSEINSICTSLLKNKAICSKDAGNRISCIFILSEYLYEVRAYQTIIMLFEENAIKYSRILGYWADLNFNQLKVYYVASLLKTAQKEKVKDNFNQINPEKFDLNFKTQILKIYNFILKNNRCFF